MAPELPTVEELMGRENYLGSILWHGGIWHVTDVGHRVRVYQVRRKGTDLVASWWLKKSELDDIVSFDDEILKLLEATHV